MRDTRKRHAPFRIEGRIGRVTGLAASFAVVIAMLGTSAAEANWGSAGCGEKATPTQ
jgi:hypothetical protein